MESRNKNKRWKFSLVTLAAAGAATVLLIEGLPAVRGPIDLAFPQEIPILPRLFDLLYATTAVTIYTVLQEHLLLRERSPREPPPVILLLIGLALLCVLMGCLPLAVDSIVALSWKLGPVSATMRFTAGFFVIILPTTGTFALLSVAIVYFVRRRMQEVATAKALRLYLAGLAGFALVFGILLAWTLGIFEGEPPYGFDVEKRGLCLFIFLPGAIGLFAGGLGQLLTRGDNKPETASET